MSSRIILVLLPSLLLVQGDGESKSPKGTPAIVFDSIGGSGGGLVVNATDGWEFSVEKPLAIISLGVWDHKLDGFATEIPVGIWNAEGQLLVSRTVPKGKAATEVDGFRYVDIAPIVLQPGTGYVIGAAYTPQTKENIGGGNSNGKFFSDGAIRWVRRRRVIRKEGLSFPEPQSGRGSIEAMPVDSARILQLLSRQILAFIIELTKLTMTEGMSWSSFQRTTTVLTVATL